MNIEKQKKQGKQRMTSLKPSLDAAMVKEAEKREMSMSEFLAYCVRYTLENNCNNFLSK